MNDQDETIEAELVADESYHMKMFAMAAVSIAAIVVAASMLFPHKPQVWADQDTGCEYVTSGGGITPRMTAIGVQRGCDWRNPDGSLQVELPPAVPSDLPPPPAEAEAVRRD